MSDHDKQPFTAHLEELWSRLIKSSIAVGLGFLLAYAFKEHSHGPSDAGDATRRSPHLH